MLVTGSASRTLACAVAVAPRRQVLDGPADLEALAFSADGQTFASAAASSIGLWGMESTPRKKFAFETPPAM